MGNFASIVTACPRVLVFIAISQISSAQETLNWFDVADGFSLRNLPGSAYDTTRDRAVWFGGSNGTRFNEVWERDAGGAWTVHIPLVRPAARSGMGFAYDPVRSYCVMFGGWSASGLRSDTWAWDGTAWTRFNPPNSPSARWLVAAEYDHNLGGVVLFGGSDGAGTHHGDTWMWNGADWVPVATASVQAPSPRQSAAMAFDDTRGEMVLYGGSDATGSLGETWVFDGTDWVQRSPAHPPAPTDGANLAYHAVWRRMVMFGGLPDPREDPELIRCWDGQDWSAHPTSTVLPVFTTQGGMVYDQARQVLLMINRHGEAWELRRVAQASTTLFGSSCVGSGGLLSLSIASAGSALPLLGETLVIDLGGVPGGVFSVPFIAIGFSNTQLGALSLPLPLDSIGAPSCSLLTSNEYVRQLVNLGSGTSSWSLPVPMDPGLAGTRAFAQGLVLDAASNALGLATSNGIAWQLGYR